MGKLWKIERELYRKVKSERSRSDEFIAFKYGISRPKVIKIRASKSFEHFEEMTRAEHPPIRDNTLGKQFNRLLTLLVSGKPITEQDKEWVKTGKRNGRF